MFIASNGGAKLWYKRSIGSFGESMLGDYVKRIDMFKTIKGTLVGCIPFKVASLCKLDVSFLLLDAKNRKGCMITRVAKVVKVSKLEILGWLKQHPCIKLQFIKTKCEIPRCCIVACRLQHK